MDGGAAVPGAIPGAVPGTPGAPAYEQVAGVLRAAIAEGRLPPGTVIREGALATLLRAGRSPVRHALSRLLAEGLLQRRDGRGLVVGSAAGSSASCDLSAATLGLGDAPATLGRTANWRRVYDVVERDLVLRSVLGCFRVNELELARFYGIGRSVAAQVLLRAEALGLITKRDTGHWFIVPLDEQRLDNLYALRILLEGAAVAEAALRVPEDVLDGMWQRSTAAREAYPQVTAHQLDVLEHDLHVDALGWAPNPELLDALGRTRCVILSSKHLLGEGVRYPADDPFLEEHAAVLAALRRRDGAEAQRAMVAHLRSAQRKVSARLSSFRASFDAPALPYLSAADSRAG
ncbi:GntR family transcriptional regulator [Roseomonas elaeocarpi]|uniref:GntR family transcriptional regulator n=1 Tax=Roseomonas elaeocarpi TaxID=907779 RepID=A0ABV6JW54_9PROT